MTGRINGMEDIVSFSCSISSIVLDMIFGNKKHNTPLQELLDRHPCQTVSGARHEETAVPMGHLGTYVGR